MDISIVEKIGLPALLEQTAEECNELAQACLKYARKLRGENPTPKTEEKCIEDLNEEAADVMLCIGHLMIEDIVDQKQTLAIGEAKELRWLKRIEEHEMLSRCL